jgi:nucleoside-triphosphatase
MNNLLLTGPPGVGKTTVMRALSGEIADLCPRGFTTDEIREDGRRRGFALVGLDGRRAVLAHEDIRSRRRVGRYGVDLEAFETFLAATPLTDSASGVVIVDEIGKMECFSEKFVHLVERLLGSGTLLVATVAQKGGGFIAEVKKRDDVCLVSMDGCRRDGMPQRLAEEVRRRLAGM